MQLIKPLRMIIVKNRDKAMHTNISFDLVDYVDANTNLDMLFTRYLSLTNTIEIGLKRSIQ